MTDLMLTPVELQERKRRRNMIQRAIDSLTRTDNREGERLPWQQQHIYPGTFRALDALRFLKEYDPSSVSYDTLKWLSEFFASRPAFLFLITTLLAAVRNAHFKNDNPDIAAFHEELTKPWLRKLASVSFKYAFRDGVSFNEIVRIAEQVEVKREDEETGEKTTAYSGTALVIDQIIHAVVTTITDVWKTEREKPAGFTQDGKATVYCPGIEPQEGQPDPSFNLSWAWIYSINDEENPVWGEAELKVIYELAYWITLFMAQAMRRAEREGSGAMIGHAPIGTSTVEDANGGTEEVDNLRYLADLASQLQEHFVAIFPFEVDVQTGQLKWNLQEMSLSEKSTIFLKMVEFLKKAIFVTLLVPEDVLHIGDRPYGSRTAVQTLFDAFEERMAGILDAWVKQVEEQILRPSDVEHFGATAPRTSLVVKLTDAQRARAAAIFEKVLGAHPDTGRLDLVKWAEEEGIPVKEQEDREAQAQQAPSQSPQPTTQPQPQPEKAPPTPTPQLALDPTVYSFGEAVEHAQVLLEAGWPADTEIVLYDPSQPRIPAGQPGGGQWTSGGGALSGAGSINRSGSDLVWKAEDTIAGEVIIETPDDFDTKSVTKDNLRAFLKAKLPRAGLVSKIKKPEDIEDIEVKNVDRGKGWLRVEVDITPTEEAGRAWLDEEAYGEEWETYHEL